MKTSPSKGRRSREKGKRGEREVAKLLSDAGYESRRGVQFCGGGDSPDVISELPCHIEVKRTEKFNLWGAMDQASADAVDMPPIVFHRPSHRPWVIVMYAEDFLELLRKEQS